MWWYDSDQNLFNFGGNNQYKEQSVKNNSVHVKHLVVKLFVSVVLLVLVNATEDR